ncbi:MAG: glutamate 5-kinase, partial [Lachnospiraceae bacterium]|nr:glutamate 5-kinase [Candidatus Equihabitans merdae]
FIPFVYSLDDQMKAMAKESTGSSVGTGGMATKLKAAGIASAAGCDMIIAKADDFSVIENIMNGEDIGTFFKAHAQEQFSLSGTLESL